MPFFVLGINHRTAPVDIREKVVFTANDLPEALRELTQLSTVQEAVIVSTCNRTELYCYAESDPPLADWLAHWHDLASQHIENSLYRHEDARAVAHLFSVASGLDSMIIGEPQILGQLKDAYRAAQDHRSTGAHL